MANRLLTIETNAGKPIAVGDAKVVPFAQTFRIQIPGWNGGIIWNRPVSVAVISTDRYEEVLPVVDITRQVQMLLLGISILSSLLIWLIFRTSYKRME